MGKMQRNTNLLKDREFDVLIVGAGIYGATAAWEAASRGLSVALLDRGDFGGFTSANSLKTVHGGLRYLQTLDVERVRESVRERRILLKIAPHLVRPLCCVVPTYGHLMKSKWVMRFGLLANDILSFDRNRGLDPDRRIPSGSVISKQDCMGMVLGIDGSRVTGAALWSDAQMASSERLLLSFILSAVQAGATAVNYAEVTGFAMSKNRIHGVRVKDVLSGGDMEVRAKVVLNAAGGFVDKVLAKAIPGIAQKKITLSTAMNLVFNKSLLPGCAAGVTSRFSHARNDGRVHRGSRVLFIAPWGEFTLIGTHHRPYPGDPDGLAVTEEEISEFLGEAARAYPGTALEREDVTFFHKGFLPMDGVNPKTGEVQLTKHCRIHDHARETGVEGLVSVVGVKYTTARDVAQKTVNVLFRKLKKGTQKSVSRETPIYGGDVQRFEKFQEKVAESAPFGLPRKITDRLTVHYGTDYPNVLKSIEKNPELGRTVPGSNRVIAAEIVHAVREEAAVKLADVILRRTDLGAGRHPGTACLNFCAGLMANELGWDKLRIEKEIRETESCYRTVQGKKS
jgi:glycerol-3-phosphate dehydrogenase